MCIIHHWGYASIYRPLSYLFRSKHWKTEVAILFLFAVFKKCLAKFEWVLFGLCTCLNMGGDFSSHSSYFIYKLYAIKVILIILLGIQFSQFSNFELWNKLKCNDEAIAWLDEIAENKAELSTKQLKIKLEITREKIKEMKIKN